MPKLTLQIEVSDDLAKQIDLLAGKATSRETVLQNALQLGLLDLFDTANRVQRDFLEQNAIHSTGHFGTMLESRAVTVTTQRTAEAKPITLPRST